MKIAIHHRTGSFSEYWIKYCHDHYIDHKIVDCYRSDIISNIEDCDILMWHWIQWHSRDVLFAKQLIYSVELMGKKVFPNTRTCQFFDDKLGQKYLFEALNIAHIPSWIFYYKMDSIKWMMEAPLPKVFKLRGGASSVNVKLVKTRGRGLKLIRKAFSGGFNPNDRKANLMDRIRKFRKDVTRKRFIHVLKGFVRLVYPNEHERARVNDKSYVYFQDFIDNNKFDIRVNVIGDKAFALKRFVRKNDFRASGSGNIIFSPDEIDDKYIFKAFEINKKLKMQSVSFDFMKKGDEILLCEISYSFVMFKWPGYWTRDGLFHKVEFTPADFMISNIINEMN